MKLPNRASPPLPVVPFSMCPAKTFTPLRPGGTKDEVLPGRFVFEHCAIVGSVAQELISRLPTPLQSMFPPGSAFAAGCHDIGKVSPYFYEKIRRAITQTGSELPRLPVLDPSMEKQWGGHAGVSQASAASMGAPDIVAKILGSHHGFHPALGGRSGLHECFGGRGWQEERHRLVQALAQELGQQWPDITRKEQAWLVSGLTTVADWIGSGWHFEDPSRPWKDLVSRAVDDAGFVAPSYRKGLSFEQVFGFSPRPAQQALIDQVVEPGVYLFEAPMGLGKTEAALYAAYSMLASGQASGIYFALPTQLTSNKIQDRFEVFLEKILDPSCKHRSWLLHASAWMLEADQGEEARPGGSWFSQSKRGLLAPFAVGTIDQALMGVMRVRHSYVRTFGLAGKVVILDEVHTYDSYTGTILDFLVEMLRKIGCTVIILSATLDSARRESLITGSGNGNAYPQVVSQFSSNPSEVKFVAIDVPPDEGRTVDVRLVGSRQLALEEAVFRAQSGQQVLWIENTVAQAQETFQILAARAQGVECGLLHSRFTQADRTLIEDKWVHAFGKSGWSDRPATGRILVGTQVLEQSLDLDADFLVSAFAPTDMLLQRLGRLWRHAGTPRPASARQQAWVIAPDLAEAIDDPVSSFGSSAFVYAPYVLCRSLQVWSSVSSVRLPFDIRDLIELTYAPAQNEPKRMARLFEQMEKGDGRFIGRSRLRSLARESVSDFGNANSDDLAGAPATRFSDRPTMDVVLVKSFHFDEQNNVSSLVLADGTNVSIPRSRGSLDKASWRKLAAQVARNSVRVDKHNGPPTPLSSVETLAKFGFGNVVHLGDPEEPSREAVVQVAVISPNGHLASLASPLSQSVYRYDSRLGYQVPSKVKEQPAKNQVKEKQND